MGNHWYTERMERMSNYITENADEIVARWCALVEARLGLENTRRPQLINDIPELIVDIAAALAKKPSTWAASSAKAHARQRIELGMDIGGLAEEIGMLGEVICEGIEAARIEAAPHEIAILFRYLARSASESATEFARLSRKALENQSARHFSFVAHELRTPLQTAQLAVALVGGPHTETAGVRIRESLAHLATLVDNSLVDARLMGEPELNRENVRAADLVRDAITFGADLAEQKGIEVISEVDEFELDIDRRLMVSALTNLVVNGVKFSSEGTVRVCATDKGARVHFQVHDSCGGLPEGAAAKMFQRFGQAGSDRSGFGLGLAIVKQAVELHGGSARVIDNPGHGCSILLELPKVRGRLSRNRALPEEPTV